ncbi:MAG: M28 family peptidase, partial [Calditrichia bacterium]
KIVAEALGNKWGYEKLRELCRIGPRLSGSQNSMKAILWAKQTMEQMGLDGVELQPVMVPHWVRGKVEEAQIMGGKELAIASLGGSIGTPEKGITAQVLEVHSFEELHKKKELARGKIIFFNRPFDPTKTNTFLGYVGAVDQRSRGAIEAAKAGGVAALVRSVTPKYDNVPHVGSMHYADSVKKVPSAAVGVIDADYLSKNLKDNPELRVNIKLSCQTLPDIQSYNVIGEILGSEKPDEIVVVSGHFDSWDKGEGAHDDGAGSMQALEVLHLIKKLGIHPRRTIRCVLFINEENGVRGGKEYARLADSSTTSQHIAAIESDRGGFSPRGFSVSQGTGAIGYFTNWLPLLRPAGIDWIRKGYSGVDIAQMKKCRVLLGLVPDSQRYFDFHHSDNDIFEAVHPREMELGSAAMAILAYLISEEGIPDSVQYTN